MQYILIVFIIIMFIILAISIRNLIIDMIIRLTALFFDYDYNELKKIVEDDIKDK